MVIFLAVCMLFSYFNVSAKCICHNNIFLVDESDLNESIEVQDPDHYDFIDEEPEVLGEVDGRESGDNWIDQEERVDDFEPEEQVVDESYNSVIHDPLSKIFDSDVSDQDDDSGDYCELDESIVPMSLEDEEDERGVVARWRYRLATLNESLPMIGKKAAGLVAVVALVVVLGMWGRKSLFGEKEEEEGAVGFINDGGGLHTATPIRDRGDARVLAAIENQNTLLRTLHAAIEHIKDSMPNIVVDVLRTRSMRRLPGVGHTGGGVEEPQPTANAVQYGTPLTSGATRGGLVESHRVEDLDVTVAAMRELTDG